MAKLKFETTGSETPVSTPDPIIIETPEAEDKIIFGLT